MKRKLPEPRDGWKDASGKTHKVHLDAITYHKTLSAILWQIMDIVHHQSTGGSTPTPDVLLARLVPFDTLEEKIDTYSVLELLTMGINCVHEAAHSVYVKHVYNGTVAETFLGDELFGADRTIPVEDRVDSAVKRVQKLTTAAKAAVGQTGRGIASKRGTRRGGSNGGRFDNRNYNGDYGNRPREQYNYGRGSGASGSYDSNRNGSFGRESGPRTCFICGSTGHQAKQCPKGN